MIDNIYVIACGLCLSYHDACFCCVSLATHRIDPWTNASSSPTIGINSQLQKETEHWNACLDMFNTRVQEKLQDVQTYNDELAAICTQCTEQGTMASAFISDQVLTISPVNIDMIIESAKKQKTKNPFVNTMVHVQLN